MSAATGRALALAASLDGTAALMDTDAKAYVAKVETGRVAPKAGENGELPSGERSETAENSEILRSTTADRRRKR